MRRNIHHTATCKYKHTHDVQIEWMLAMDVSVEYFSLDTFVSNIITLEYKLISKNYVCYLFNFYLN